jgi:exodeoxyribonuclease VII large subunit
LFDIFATPPVVEAQPPKDAAPVKANTVPRPAAVEAIPETPAKPRVWSVAALVREVRGLVERSYGQVTVEGEISNWRPAGSGHCYFTLKDGDAQLAAVMFRRSASLLRFRPKDGDAVRLRGQISVYENRGQMQLIADSMELAGQGALLAAVQQLKEKLRREGLFERKRPLPAFPKCIGIVTSLQGAALRDIVKVCRRRHAAVNLLIYPAAVQGPRCAIEIIAGLRWFNAHPGRADVVLVARGGGSWEDLHGFDDEGVARAIAACAVPVIAGIGHATDTTIADAAADVCAPTPSAAAELVTAAQHQVEERVARLQARVLRAGRYELLRARQRFSNVAAETSLRRMRDALRQRDQRVDELGFRAEAAIARSLAHDRGRLSRLETRLQRQHVTLRVAGDRQRLERLSLRLEAAGRAVILPRRSKTEQSVVRLNALSPLRVLERGYALVYGANGKLLRTAKAAQEGEALIARLADGSVEATVTRTFDTEK